MINNYVIVSNEDTPQWDATKQVIQGNNPIQALKTAFNKDYKRVYGIQRNNASIMLVQGTLKDNELIPNKYNYVTLCYCKAEDLYR